ncbi:uncharacterized protein EV154DRAFT_485970 [Mucor mucedo]|uniref:uncharacterized protein n=1 Tax=Mucor mucedo TaxID=29922 RepID=UPI0022208224|nr:uncharacterized protein EV154DRAFT_485970 [Mucor mucedo]KAI7880014.1 hypothetical protein EV154DRAFT_485970 [Mucor mucedo]
MGYLFSVSDLESSLYEVISSHNNVSYCGLRSCNLIRLRYNMAKYRTRAVTEISLWRLNISIVNLQYTELRYLRLAQDGDENGNKSFNVGGLSFGPPDLKHSYEDAQKLALTRLPQAVFGNTIICCFGPIRGMFEVKSFSELWSIIRQDPIRLETPVRYPSKSYTFRNSGPLSVKILYFWALWSVIRQDSILWGAMVRYPSRSYTFENSDLLSVTILWFGMI